MAGGEGVLMLSVSGLRGHIGSTLTPDVAARFAAALAGWLTDRRAAARPTTGRAPRTARTPRPSIALGRDGRRGSDLFASVARAALLAAGCDVIDLDIAMTPTVGVVVDQFALDAGLVVTASHNPQNWCGLKPILRAAAAPAPRAGVVSAAAPTRDQADELIARFRQTAAPVPAAWTSLGHARVDPAMQQAHAVLVREALGPAARALRGLKTRVLIDHLGMSGAAMAEPALRALAPRADVAALFPASVEHEDPDLRGRFPHEAEPTAANLKGLARAVRARGAHAGFAQDPDADRLALVDERGRYLGEEYTLVLAALALGALGRLGRGDTLAVNLSTSRMIDDVAARFGARVVRTRVGEANVAEAMKAHRCVLGGEGNGGVIWPDVTYIRDSLGAMALILALCARTGRRLSQLAADVPAYAIVKHKVDLPDLARAREAADTLARAYAAHRIDTQDGVRIDFDDRRAWLHVRASNTEPIMRLIAEAPTRRAAQGLLDEAADLIGRNAR